MESKKKKKWIIGLGILAVLYVIGQFTDSNTNYSDACECATVLNWSDALGTGDDRYWGCKNKYTNWGGANRKCIQYNKRNK